MVPLTPELETLVADLKLGLGQRLDALVTRTLAISDTERRQLLERHNATTQLPGQRQLISLLQDPALKLVELKVQQQLVPTLTNLPLQQAQTVQVVVTPRGLLLLPSVSGTGVPADAAIPPPQTTAQPSAAPSPNAVSVPPAQNPALGKPVTMPGAPHPLPTGKMVPSAPDTVQASPPAALTGKTLTPSLAHTGSGRLQSTDISSRPSLTGLSPATANAVRDSPGVHGSLDTKMPLQRLNAEIQPLLANAMARTLPMAQELPPLLRAIHLLNQQLQQLTPAAQPPQLQQLQNLLNRLPNLSLDVAQLNPARPLPLQQAIAQSGIFYEHRLLDSARTEAVTRDLAALPERDLKGLLIQLQQWLGSPHVLATSVRSAAPDALSQLFLGLAQLFNARQRPHSEVPPSKQLVAAMQQLVDRSLARIQTQQYRSLNSQILDPATPQQWHLDIPLRLPEGYGNLYLQLFEPRVPPEPEKDREKKQARSSRKNRWRVFMELTLDEMGALAAEISVLEDNLQVTLWAEKGDLRQRANAHLLKLRQDLEQQGLTVQELRCSQNPPPAQKMRLDYALIDVKT